ncbi:MAG: hypothetical protein L0387_14180 [Acidobacteria bacterium]|nr:hypothetical protein [Acidobacteriota bacterium]
MTDAWRNFLKRTLRFPWRLLKNLRLMLYFVIVVCFVGALGTLIPLAQIYFGSTTLSWLSVHRSLATYVIAIAVTAFADCVVSRRQEDDATFILFLLGLTILSTVCAIVVLLVAGNEVVPRLSSAGAALAAIVWLMVHDADPLLAPDDAYSALGGEKLG